MSELAGKPVVETAPDGTDSRYLGRLGVDREAYCCEHGVSLAVACSECTAAEPQPAPEDEPDSEGEGEGEEDEGAGEDEDVPCPYCAGSGSLEAAPPQDPYARTCDTCHGWGKVLTGSLVAAHLERQCERCMGLGFLVRQVEPAPVTLTAAPNESLAYPLPGSDSWTWGVAGG